MQPEYERRSMADVKSEGTTIIGYAIVFDSPSQDLGGFVEVFEPSAVDRTLRDKADVRALVNHDPTMVLGRTTAKTLRLAKDAHGLRVEIDAPDTTAGRDIVTSVQRGDVTGMSFEFQVPKGGDRFERRGNILTRVVSDSIIREVSVVTWPVYLATDAKVAQRAMQAHQQRGPSIAWLRRRAQAGPLAGRGVSR